MLSCDSKYMYSVCSFVHHIVVYFGPQEPYSILVTVDHDLWSMVTTFWSRLKTFWSRRTTFWSNRTTFWSRKTTFWSKLISIFLSRWTNTWLTTLTWIQLLVFFSKSWWQSSPFSPNLRSLIFYAVFLLLLLHQFLHLHGVHPKMLSKNKKSRSDGV